MTLLQTNCTTLSLSEGQFQLSIRYVIATDKENPRTATTVPVLASHVYNYPLPTSFAESTTASINTPVPLRKDEYDERGT